MPGPPTTQKWIAAVAKDLQAHRGRSLVVAGEYQPRRRARARAIDERGARQRRHDGDVRAPRSKPGRPTDTRRSPSSPARWTPARSKLLVILGGNPVFTAPVESASSPRSWRRSASSVYHGLYVDETANLCSLEHRRRRIRSRAGATRARSTARSRSCSRSMAPLYEGRSAHEMLGAFTPQAGPPQPATREGLLDARVRRQRGWTITDADGQPFANADAFWRRALHDGFIPGTAVTDGGPATPFKPGPPRQRSGGCHAGPGRAIRRRMLPLDRRRPCRRRRNRSRRRRRRFPRPPRATWRSSSDPIRPSGTAASPTTAGCRNCRSR